MDTPVRRSLRRYQGLLWALDVRVAGTERTFLLDLAAGVTAVTPHLADELGLGHVRTVTGRRMTGAEVRIDLHDGLSLGLGERTLALAHVGVLDMVSLLPPDWPAVDGVLALDVLEDVPFTLDLVREEVVLETAASLGRRVEEGAPLRSRRRHEIPDVSLDVLAAVAAPGGTLWFELDSANAGPVVVSPRSAEALGITAGAGETTLAVEGLGDVATAYVVREILLDGNLGRTVLDGRVLTFDLANDRVVAAPGSRDSSQNQP